MRNLIAMVVVAVAGSFPLSAALAAGAPAAGESYTYRLVNGYNQEVQGRISHQVDRVDGNRVVVSVAPDGAAAGAARTEVYTPDGNWLQRQMESHGAPVEYAFATPYPAYVFPLDPGKTWSTRVNATARGGAARVVRVDGRVLGTERVRVPAGEFDTIKVRRFVYAGDKGDPFFSQQETQITETDWYAPSLGRPVRTERRSVWLDPSQCGQDGGCDFRGSWDIYELEPVAKR